MCTTFFTIWKQQFVKFSNGTSSITASAFINVDQLIYTAIIAMALRVFWACSLVGPGHNSDVMSAMASQITGVSIVYSTVCSDADQRKHQISASLAFVRGIHRSPVNSPHKEPVTRKMFPFNDVIMRDAAVILIQYMIIRYLEHSMWNRPQTNATRPRR